MFVNIPIPYDHKENGWFLIWNCMGFLKYHAHSPQQIWSDQSFNYLYYFFFLKKIKIKTTTWKAKWNRCYQPEGNNLKAKCGGPEWWLHHVSKALLRPAAILAASCYYILFLSYAPVFTAICCTTENSGFEHIWSRQLCFSSFFEYIYHWFTSEVLTPVFC